MASQVSHQWSQDQEEGETTARDAAISLSLSLSRSSHSALRELASSDAQASQTIEEYEKKLLILTMASQAWCRSSQEEEPKVQNADMSTCALGRSRHSHGVSPSDSRNEGVEHRPQKSATSHDATGADCGAAPAGVSPSDSRNEGVEHRPQKSATSHDAAGADCGAAPAVLINLTKTASFHAAEDGPRRSDPAPRMLSPPSAVQARPTPETEKAVPTKAPPPTVKHGAKSKLPLTSTPSAVRARPTPETEKAVPTKASPAVKHGAKSKLPLTPLPSAVRARPTPEPEKAVPTKASPPAVKHGFKSKPCKPRRKELPCLDEMKRLMRVYGPLKCFRRRPVCTDNEDATRTRVKRRFYRWFPDLDERFDRAPKGGWYVPKAGHKEEMRYREARRGEDLVRWYEKRRAWAERRAQARAISSQGGEMSGPSGYIPLSPRCPNPRPHPGENIAVDRLEALFGGPGGARKFRAGE